jgi:hypothetical protein
MTKSRIKARSGINLVNSMASEPRSYWSLDLITSNENIQHNLKASSITFAEQLISRLKTFLDFLEHLKWHLSSHPRQKVAHLLFVVLCRIGYPCTTTHKQLPVQSLQHTACHSSFELIKETDKSHFHGRSSHANQKKSTHIYFPLAPFIDEYMGYCLNSQS